MGSKIVVAVISVILVVGIVVGVVVVVQHGNKNANGNDNDKSNVNGNGKQQEEKVSGSMKMVNSLCGSATFKDACIKSLGPVAQNESATAQDLVQAGVKLALEEMTKAFNFTDTFIPKAKDTKYPNRTETAIDSCKNYFDTAMDRLGEVVRYAQHREAYDNEFLVWYIRLSLSDAITFTDACVEGFSEVEAPELGSTMKNGVNNGREVTFNMLDIVTIFNKALASINATQLAEMAAVVASSASNFNGSAMAGRDLLGSFPVDEGGYPAWLPPADRELLVLDSGDDHERKMQQKMKNNKKKGGKQGGNKNKKKMGKKAVGAAMGGGVAVAVGGAAAAVGSAPSVAPGEKLPPNAVVAQDGSGQYKTIMDAVRAHPGTNLQGRWVIYVKAGTYKEEVFLEKNHVNIFMYGDGPRATIVTGDKNFGIQKVKTDRTAPFHVEAPGFFAKDMGFQNTAGTEGHQAVALRTKGEFGVFQNCWFDGYQDTLYVQAGSHFFRDCEIKGTVDFIFGDGATLIQNSNILVKKGNLARSPMLVVTAEGGVSPNAPTGIVIQGSKILPDADLVPVKSQFESYLGRPWKPYCRTVIMETEIGDFIKPEGYSEWKDPNSPNNHLTAFYGEYNNNGAGANAASRVKWPHFKVLSKPEADRYSVAAFLKGGQWVKDSGVPANFNVA